MMGIDPYVFIDEDDEHYLIKLAMLTKARKLRQDEREQFIKLLGAEIMGASLLR